MLAVRLSVTDVSPSLKCASVAVDSKERTMKFFTADFAGVRIQTLDHAIKNQHFINAALARGGIVLWLERSLVNKVA